MKKIGTDFEQNKESRKKGKINKETMEKNN